MRQKDHIENIAGHLQEQMNRTSEYLSGFQKTPMGTRERGAREQKRIWKEIMSMDEPERNALMSAMGERAGHTPDEDRPCELCRFIGKHVGTD